MLTQPALKQFSMTVLSTDYQMVIQKPVNTIQSAVVVESSKLDLILAALFAQGHVLLEDVPGIGKTSGGEGAGKISARNF